MAFLNNYNQKMWGIILIAIGLAGTIFFFPVNINSQYTCLYHRLFTNGNHSYHHHTSAPESAPDTGVVGSEEKIISPNTNPDLQAKSDFESNIATGENLITNSDILNHYIQQFALFWWSSILFIVSGYFFFRFSNKKKSFTNNY